MKKGLLVMALYLKTCNYLAIFMWLLQDGYGSGSYKSTLLRADMCTNPDIPYEKNKIVTSTISAYKKSGYMLLKGNLTFHEDIKDGVMAFKFGLIKKVKGSNYSYSIKYKQLTCKNILVKVIYNALHLKTDLKSCTVYKGNYVFDNLDINNLDHAVNFIPMREMGKNIWYIAYYGVNGTYICITLHVDLKYV